MGIPSAYGWAALAALLIGFIILIRYWIRKAVSIEAALERETRARLEAERMAKEYGRVAEIRARDLGATPGVIVRDIDKSGPASGPANN